MELSGSGAYGDDFSGRASPPFLPPDYGIPPRHSPASSARGGGGSRPTGGAVVNFSALRRYQSPAEIRKSQRLAQTLEVMFRGGTNSGASPEKPTTPPLTKNSVKMQSVAARKARDEAEAAESERAPPVLIPATDLLELQHLNEVVRGSCIVKPCARFAHFNRVGTVRWTVMKGLPVNQELVRDFCRVHQLSIVTKSASVDLLGASTLLLSNTNSLAGSSGSGAAAVPSLDLSAMPTVDEMEFAVATIKHALKHSNRVKTAIRRLFQAVERLKPPLQKYVARRRRFVQQCLEAWDKYDDARKEKLRERLSLAMRPKGGRGGVADANVAAKNLRYQNAIESIKQRTLARGGGFMQGVLTDDELHFLTSDRPPLALRRLMIHQSLRMQTRAFRKRYNEWRSKNNQKIFSVRRQCGKLFGNQMSFPQLAYLAGVTHPPEFEWHIDPKVFADLLEKHILQELQRDQEEQQRLASIEADRQIQNLQHLGRAWSRTAGGKMGGNLLTLVDPPAEGETYSNKHHHSAQPPPFLDSPATILLQGSSPKGEGNQQLRYVTPKGGSDNLSEMLNQRLQPLRSYEQPLTLEEGGGGTTQPLQSSSNVVGRASASVLVAPYPDTRWLSSCHTEPDSVNGLLLSKRANNAQPGPFQFPEPDDPNAHHRFSKQSSSVKSVREVRRLCKVIEQDRNRGRDDRPEWEIELDFLRTSAFESKAGVGLGQRIANDSKSPRGVQSTMHEHYHHHHDGTVLGGAVTPTSLKISSTFDTAKLQRRLNDTLDGESTAQPRQRSHWRDHHQQRNFSSNTPAMDIRMHSQKMSMENNQTVTSQQSAQEEQPFVKRFGLKFVAIAPSTPNTARSDLSAARPRPPQRKVDRSYAFHTFTHNQEQLSAESSAIRSPSRAILRKRRPTTTTTTTFQQMLLHGANEREEEESFDDNSGEAPPHQKMTAKEAHVSFLSLSGGLNRVPSPRQNSEDIKKGYAPKMVTVPVGVIPSPSSFPTHYPNAGPLAEKAVSSFHKPKSYWVPGGKLTSAKVPAKPVSPQ